MTDSIASRHNQDGSRQAASSTSGETSVMDSRAPSLSQRPWVWVLLGMLIGAILLGLLLTQCTHEQALEPHAGSERRTTLEAEAANRQVALDADLDAQLSLRRAHNAGLEAEINRLRTLLSEDPCVVDDALGPAPQAVPVSPGNIGFPTPQVFEEKGASSSRTEDSPPPGTATPAVPAVTQPPTTVADLLAQATVFVLSTKDEAYGMGTGFFVAPGVVVTNRHVVLSPNAEVLVGNKALDGMRKARIIAISDGGLRDYALLRVSGTTHAPSLPLAVGVVRTERVSAWGFPGYITQLDPKLAALASGDIKAVPEVVYTEGSVSVIHEGDPEVILHTAPISQGNSGGPLVNAQGQVVGINTFLRQADKSFSQTSIALPSGDLARFLRQHGVVSQ